MDERELEQLFEKLRTGADLTDQELRKLGRGTSEFGESLKKAGLDLSKTMGGFAKNLAEGATDFKQLNPIIDGVTGALGEMAKAIPYAGNAVAGALKLVAEGSKFLIGQLQEATTAFQEVSKIGGLTAQGMSGLREQFLRSGQTLQGFQRTVSSNAQALARFSGSVGSGAEDFSRIVGGIIDSDLGDQLRRIGFTADEIGETTAGYITQQTRLGYAQNKTQQQLIQGSKQYADELDQLARLTGTSREALQKQQDAALSEGRFRATLDTLDEKTAKALLDFQSRLAGAGLNEMAQGVRDITSGFTQSEAAIKLFQSTGGEATNIIERMKAGQIDQGEATRQLQQAIRNNLEVQRTYAQAVGDGTGTFIKYNEASDFARATIEDNAIKVARAQKEAQAGTDDLTNKTVDAQKSLEQMGRNLNNMAFQALPAASTAVNAFTGVLNKATAEISKELGIKPPAGTAPSGAAPGGYGKGGRGTMGGSLASTAAGAAAGAALGSFVPGLGTAIGGAVGGYLGYLGYQIGGGPGAEGAGAAGQARPEDVIKFGTNTGSREHFDKLEPAVKAAFMNMAMEYKSMTGDKLQINSAFRSPEEQANVNSGNNPRAAPGRSLHQQGRALDIQTSQADYLISQGLLDKHGFKSGRAFNDPPHIYMKDGGIAAGPKSGYAATLHGTEAVVPLPDGKTIPVNIPGFTDNMGEQLSMMGAQLSALESLVAAMRDQNSISNKILQATNN